jgi:hypothetical protein
MDNPVTFLNDHKETFLDINITAKTNETNTQQNLLFIWKLFYILSYVYILVDGCVLCNFF